MGFNSHLKKTFSSAYWLQKNITIQYFSTSSKHVLIYTLPITNSYLSTTVDFIDSEFVTKSSPIHKSIQSLTIRSNSDDYSPKLSIIHVFNRFPYVTHLRLETVLLLPSNVTICSTRLRCLSLCNYTLSSCCQLLGQLPQVTSLSITGLSCKILTIDTCSKSYPEITRLKISIDAVQINNLFNIIQYFPNVNEFSLLIKNPTNRSIDDFRQDEKFELFSQGFIHLRYFEVTLPIKQDSLQTSNWLDTLNPNQWIFVKASNGNSVILKTWL